MKIHYHSDHLGSASFVTNIDGYVMQHLQYLPYGELFVSQRNTDEFDSRYKFTAKELDNETSYTYFGARYYDSDLSSWLSVDPLSDKYPSTSAYMYCSGNPVKLIDPNGMDIVPTNGVGNIAILSYLNNFSVKTQQKAFGYYGPNIGYDPQSGRYPIYTSIHKGMISSPEQFRKSLGREGKSMSETEFKEAYSFYLALASEGQYKVEVWAPSTSFTTGEEVQGSKMVDFVPGYAPREVHNNRHLENDLNDLFYETDFDKIFNPNRTSSDARNKFEDGFNFYQNYVRNPQNPNDRNTIGVIVIDARNSNWKNILGRAFQSVLELE